MQSLCGKFMLQFLSQIFLKVAIVGWFEKLTLSVQGTRSQGGRGGGPPPVFKGIYAFWPKKRGFAPLFFRASYGPTVYIWFFICHLNVFAQKFLSMFMD